MVIGWNFVVKVLESGEGLRGFEVSGWNLRGCVKIVSSWLRGFQGRGENWGHGRIGREECCAIFKVEPRKLELRQNKRAPGKKFYLVPLFS